MMFEKFSRSHFCAGDLVYLDCVTLEGEYLCITGSTTGFFVNSTQQYGPLKPQISEPNFRSMILADVLRKYSSKFSDRFQAQLSRPLVAHPLSRSELLTPLTPSTAAVPFTATSPLPTATPPSSTDSERNWNSDFQDLLESLRQSTLPDAVLQFERNLHTLLQQFNNTAACGVQLVVDGFQTAANSVEHPLNHIFFYQSILMTPVIGSRRSFPQLSVCVVLSSPNLFHSFFSPFFRSSTVIAFCLISSLSISTTSSDSCNVLWTI